MIILRKPKASRISCGNANQETMRAIIRFGKKHNKFPTDIQLGVILNMSRQNSAVRKHSLKRIGALVVDENKIYLYPEKVGLDDEGNKLPINKEDGE